MVVGDDGVLIEVKKLEKSSRRIRSKIGMEASLDAVWSVLTDYEKLSDFIPGLVVSELVEKEGNRVRLFQVLDLNPRFLLCQKILTFNCLLFTMVKTTR